MEKTKSTVPVIIAVILTAIILSIPFSACSADKAGKSTQSNLQEETSVSETVLESSSHETIPTLGTGEKSFTFEVINPDGSTAAYEIYTDTDTVGSALMELGLIAGEEGPHGLYVTTVDGHTLDYKDGGYYWAFYENGEYGTAGVDVTEITPGNSYSFRASK